MAYIQIHFQKADTTPLGTVELADDVPIRMLVDQILEQLGQDETAEWCLILPEGGREIDLQYAQTLADLGIGEGDVIRLCPGVRRLGRYELCGEIRSGASGTVYEAYDPALDRRVAIQIIDQEFAQDERALQRLAQEARTVALLEDHASVVKIYDFEYQGQGADQPSYVVMEYLEGQRLDQLVKEHDGLSLEQAAEILTAVASALDLAHEERVIHRDIRTENVLLQQDPSRPGQWIPKLMDLGLVPAAGGADAVDEPDGLLRSPYMSPEQLKGEPLTRRSDIYSLGVVVYEMLTGRRPFQEGTDSEIISDHLLRAPPPPSHFRDMPASVESVVVKALAKDPGDRYATAGEFAQAFRDAAQPTATEAAVKGPRKVPLGALIGAVGLLLALLAVGIWALFLRPDRLPDLDVLLERGQGYVEAGRYEEARTTFALVLEQEPANAEALAGTGRAYEAQEEWSQAAEWYERWAQAAPAEVEAYLALGRTDYHMGDYWEAVAQFERAADLDPTSVQAWQGQAESLYQLQEYEQVLDPLQQWDRLEPDQVAAKEMLGWAYFHLERYEEAVDPFRELTQLAPDAPVGYEGLGRTLYRLGEYENALPVLQQWAQMADDPGRAQALAGWSALLAGDYDMAVILLEEALRAQEEASLHLALGRAYYEMEDFDRALFSFQSALAMEPGWAEPYWRIGRVHLEQERWQQAVDFFLQAVDLGAESPYLFSGLGYAYRALEQHEEALAAFQRWADMQQGLARAWGMVGWSYFSLQSYGAAVEAFTRAIELPDGDAFLYGLAESYRRMGNCSQAIPYYDRVLELSPADENAQRGRELCQPF